MTKGLPLVVHESNRRDCPKKTSTCVNIRTLIWNQRYTSSISNNICVTSVTVYKKENQLITTSSSNQRLRPTTVPPHNPMEQRSVSHILSTHTTATRSITIVQSQNYKLIRNCTISLSDSYKL